MKQQYLYHYTSIYALRNILKERLLKTSNHGEKVDSLWFSSNELWEVTATKMVITKKGELKKLTKEEQHKAFGLGRIVIKNSIQFTSWENYLHQAGIPLKISKAMEKCGYKKEWFCRLKNIPSSQWEEVQIWNGKNWGLYNQDSIDVHFPEMNSEELTELTLEVFLSKFI